MEQQDIWRVYQRLQQEKRVIHCITNHVTVNDCANMLLAAGASPTMAHHKEEVAEIAAGCDGLVCNLGATDDYEAMLFACQAAKSAGIPIVIDPVGVGASSFRRAFLDELVKTAAPTCIRGNYAELEAIWKKERTVKGVDADKEQKDISYYEKLTKELAQKYQCFIVASGKTDIVSDGKCVYHINNGDKNMARITGAGCMSTCLIAAYLALGKSLEHVLCACILMGICGELAAERTSLVQGGTMTFRMLLIDAMSNLQEANIVPQICVKG